MLVPPERDADSPVLGQLDQGGPPFLMSQAFAADNTPTDRLFIRSLSLPTKAVPRELEVLLTSDVGKSGLQSTLSQKTDQRLPTFKSSTLAYDYTYFLPYSAGSPSAIELRERTRLFSGYSEVFELADEIEFGEPVEIVGSEGGILTVERILPFNVVIFDKADIAVTLKAIQAALNDRGLVAIVVRSPLGRLSQTNAIFAGQDVPYTVLQLVTEAL